MATQDFVQIKAYASAVEAEQIRGVLEVEGIPAFVDGASSNTALSYVGTALGGVRVFVRSCDIERAVKIIESARSQATATPWYCGDCQETLDASFDLCWSCGKARSEVERPFPGALDHVAGEAEQAVAADCPEESRLDLTDYDESNPYASPRTAIAMERLMAYEPAEKIDEEAEAMLLRAWRASILGLVFLPIVLHLYSMYLLIRAATRADAFSADGKKRFYLAFSVNLLAAGLWSMVFRGIFQLQLPTW